MKMQDKRVHPEDNSNVRYWTKKWGISISQLNEAILNTGSLNAEHLRQYLKKDIASPLTVLIRLFKNRNITVH